MLENVLKSLNLTENEIKIYLALLPVGTAPASILAKRTGLNRSTAQYTCQQLLKKRVVRTLEKGNTFLYIPEPPEKLFYLLDQEKQVIHEKEEKLNAVLPELKGLISRSFQNIPKVKIFEGVSGIIELYDDLIKNLKPDTKLYGLLTMQLNPDFSELEKYQWEVYSPIRKKMKNPAWFLFSDNKATRAYQKEDEKMNRTSLLVPESDFSFKTTCQMYDNKVAFYADEGNNPMGVLIENDYIFESQMAIFRLAWNYALNLPANKKYKNEKI